MNEFRIGFINIGLEKSVVLAARMVGRPSRSGSKRLKIIDVYKTDAKLIMFVGAGARGFGRLGGGDS